MKIKSFLSKVEKRRQKLFRKKHGSLTTLIGKGLEKVFGKNPVKKFNQWKKNKKDINNDTK